MYQFQISYNWQTKISIHRTIKEQVNNTIPYYFDAKNMKSIKAFCRKTTLVF